MSVVGDGASTGEGNPDQRSLKADVHGIAWALVREGSSEADWGGPRVCVSAMLLLLVGTTL